MNLIEATRFCIVNAFQFSGRADRYEFWNFIVFIVLTWILLTVLNTLMFGMIAEYYVTFSYGTSGKHLTIGSKLQPDAGWFGVVFGVLIAVPLLAVTVRRLHDRSTSGWVVLLPLAIAATAHVWLEMSMVPLSSLGIGVPPELPSDLRIPPDPLHILASKSAIYLSLGALLVWLALPGKPDTDDIDLKHSEVPQ